MAGTRRAFLQTILSASGAGVLAFAIEGCRRLPLLQAKRKTARHRFFTPTEYQTLSAACERILPRDEEDPGAIDLGVPSYVDRAFADGDYAHRHQLFRRGLRDLDADAVNLTGRLFHQTDDDDQDQILGDYESGTHEETEFFRLLMDVTLEGAFGDPSHGGNKHGLGWRLIGFAPGDPMPGMHN